MGDEYIQMRLRVPRLIHARLVQKLNARRVRGEPCLSLERLAIQTLVNGFMQEAFQEEEQMESTKDSTQVTILADYAKTLDRAGMPRDQIFQSMHTFASALVLRPPEIPNYQEHEIRVANLMLLASKRVGFAQRFQKEHKG